VLRTLAVVLVIGRHFHLPPEVGGQTLAALTNVWIRGGWVGVDLFFVLSGFLVSGLLFREYQERRAVRVGRFLVRRGLKIYPAFYLLLLVRVVQNGLRTGWGTIDPRAVVSEGLFVQNYGPSLFQHTWSLAVEEHFYLLCAGLIFFLSRRRTQLDPYRAIPTIFGGVAVFCLAARLLTGLTVPYDHVTHSFRTHLRLDALMFGVCLSYLYHFRRDRLTALLAGRTRLAALLGLALIGPVFVFDLDKTFFIYTFGYSLTYLGSGLLVLSVVLSPLPETPLFRLIAGFGAYSYSIYLWHISTQTLIWGLLGRLGLSAHWGLVLAVYLSSSLVGGLLMAKLVELPVLRLRDRLFSDPLPRPVDLPELALLRRAA
jgi:peptidoglycan/LPS O-acetylase OafA/YrhL